MKDFNDFVKRVNELQDEILDCSDIFNEDYIYNLKDKDDIVRFTQTIMKASADTTVRLLSLYHQWLSANPDLK